MAQMLYQSQNIEVKEGDHVQYRSILWWWKWKPGRISYVPGVTKFHPEMEFDGLRWIGISGEDGTFRGVLIDPTNNSLVKSVKFVKRSTNKDYLSPHEIPEDEW